WLRPEDAAGYRLAGSASWPAPPTFKRNGYQAEIEELRAAGLIVDADPDQAGTYHFYLRAPTGPWNNGAVFAIGMCAGESPLRLQPLPEVANPVLTHRDVTDIPATFVADPFMVQDNGQWYLFFEVMNARSGQGEIALATSPDGVRWKYQQIVLVES